MAVGVVLVSLGWATAIPASASCLWLDASVTWDNGTTTRLTPWPYGHCVVPTPWTEFLHPHLNDNSGLGPTKEVDAEGSVPFP